MRLKTMTEKIKWPNTKRTYQRTFHISLDGRETHVTYDLYTILFFRESPYLGTDPLTGPRVCVLINIYEASHSHSLVYVFCCCFIFMMFSN